MTKEEKKKADDAKAKALADAKAIEDAKGTGDAPKDLNDIFGAQTPTAPIDPVLGTPKAPAEGKSTGMSMPAQEEGNITLSRAQYDAIMGRLNNLDSVVQKTSTVKDNVFNPLAEVKTDHEVRVAYWGDDLVVGYKAKIRPDGKQTFTFDTKDAVSGEPRKTIILLLEDAESGEIKEETMDYVRFLEGLVTVKAVIKKRTDVGKIVEHGEVEVLNWNGRQMAGTGQMVMTGAREQRFVFDLSINGKLVTLPQEVVNIL